MALLPVPGPPPKGLVEISDRVYVFGSCLTTDILGDRQYRLYIEGTVSQLQDSFPDASFMVLSFHGHNRRGRLLADVLSGYGLTVTSYPMQYEGCPLLTLKMIHHVLRSGDEWLSSSAEGQYNVLLMHCERGGWPLLAFIMAALLLYRKQYVGVDKTLEMVYRHAPHVLMQLLSPLNPVPSQIRYLQYISRRNAMSSEWPPSALADRPLTLDFLILRIIPDLHWEDGCRPIVRIYGQDPFVSDTDSRPKVIFATPWRREGLRLYKDEHRDVVKIDIHCHVQGDVVLECISKDADEDQEEEMMFRVMFNTAFIRSNILMLNSDDIDIMWVAKDSFLKGFRAEILFSEMDTALQLDHMEVSGIEEKEGLPIEPFAKVQAIFNNVDWLDPEVDCYVTEGTPPPHPPSQPSEPMLLVASDDATTSESKNLSQSSQKYSGLSPLLHPSLPPPPSTPRFSPVRSSTLLQPLPTPSGPASGYCSRTSPMGSNGTREPESLTLGELRIITGNFSKERALGQGTFGEVFKGVLANGEEIAVKLLRNNMQGIDDGQFKQEFNNLMMLSHQNIVRLVGYCYETQRQHMEFEGQIVFCETTYKALCFEYMREGSLKTHIHDESHGLDWDIRYKMIKGICMGLHYLHEGRKEPIYHLDLKPDNILLDADMVPKLADFGLSKLFGEEQTRVTQCPQGTIGYMPPEYLFQNIVSKKVDIFSLGVVMIKIIAGPKGHSRSAEMPYQEFLDLVQENWRNRLQKTPSQPLEALCKQVNKCTRIALSCMETDRHKRPSIVHIIDELNETETVIEKALS